MQLDFLAKLTSILLLIPILNACGGGSGGSQSYTLGGSISGLTGSGLTLTTGDQSVSPGSGVTSFVFPNGLSSGAAYAVQVSASPDGLTCGVTNGSGTIGGLNVTSVKVICFPSGNTTVHSFAGDSNDGAAPQGDLIQDSNGDFYGMTAIGGSANLGTVFKITPDGAETVLYSFVGGASDGASPHGSLLQADDGNFYGTTFYGGASNLGTVFKITADGTLTVLYSFAGGTSDGASPQSNLIQGSDGNFYGTTAAGGASNLGTVFKITADGTETVLYSFAGGTSDGASPQSSLIQGNDGNFYGTTLYGGASGLGTVFKITADGTETMLYSFAGGTSDGASPQSSLIQGNDGNFYGMTPTGGGLNLGTVFTITPTGTETVLHVFGGVANDGIVPYGRLIQSSDGNFYGTTFYGGNLKLGTVFKISADGTETVLFSFAGGTSDGALPRGSLLLGSDGNLYGMTTAGGGANLGTVFTALPQ